MKKNFKKLELNKVTVLNLETRTIIGGGVSWFCVDETDFDKKEITNKTIITKINVKPTYTIDFSIKC